MIVYDNPTSRYVLIGTLIGWGYKCKYDEVISPEEKWNKVTAHMGWIQKSMNQLGERACNRRGNVI